MYDLFTQEAIEEHKQKQSPEPRDFIDVYLKEIERNNDDSFSGMVLENFLRLDNHNLLYYLSCIHFVEEQLLNIILDILSAGADTTGNSIG